MPTYHYRCDSCSHEFDRFQSIMSKPVSECPECKGESRRLISGGTGVIYKGSGFYVNDYKSKGKKKAESTPAAAPACGASDGACSSCPAAQAST